MYKTNRAGLVEWDLDPKLFVPELIKKCILFGCKYNDIKFYSQQHEDKYIIQYLLKNKIDDGTYLEIGACDGILYSNTKTLEDFFGFTGILIEPQPHYFQNLIKNRSSKKNEFYNYAVSNSDDDYVSFIGNNAEGGLVDTINSNHVKENYSTYHVKNTKMREILKSSKFKYIDFMIIDVEGGEYELVKSIDFTFPIFCIIIEAHSNQQEKNKIVRNFLEENGFTYIERQRGNEVYLNKNYFRKNVFNIDVLDKGI